MSEPASNFKIAIVEDNDALSSMYKMRLEAIGYKTVVAMDGEVALTVIEKELPNLVVLDMMLPKVGGDQVLERMRQNEWGKNIKVLIISNLNEEDAPAGVRKFGIEGWAVKANLFNDDLDKLVNKILQPTQ